MPPLVMALILVGLAAGEPDLSDLAQLRPAGVRTVVVQGAGRDAPQRGGGRVLLDRAGPGILESLLIEPGPSRAPTRLRVIRDGRDAPTLDTTLDELAAGRVPGFPRPLVGVTAGVCHSAVPLAFERGLRVEWLGEAPEYYRIGLRVGGPSEVPQKPDALATLWARPEARRVEGEEPAEYPLEVGARSSALFLLPTGPRTIRSFEIGPSPETADAWKTARLRLIWEGDDPESPGVDLPLASMFGRYGELGISGSLMLDQSEGGSSWRSRFPMPYRVQGMLRIDTERPLKGRIRLRSVAGVDRDAGYFRAASHPPDEEGRGHLVGLLSVGDPTIPAARLFLDGDDLGPWDAALGLPRSAREPGEHGIVLGSWHTSVGANRKIWGRYRWMAADPMTYHQSLRLEGSSGRAEDRRDVAGSRSAWFWYSEWPGNGPPANIR
ncbi:MAG: DUF2961 domain-containing protein [Isosphaeraceae bacterium]